MSPETDANDHVPLEFLLGARVKHYYPGASIATRQGRSSNVRLDCIFTIPRFSLSIRMHLTRIVVKAKRLFATSIHPRRREEQARRLLQQVLDEEGARVLEGPPESALLPAEVGRKALLKARVEAAPTSRLEQEAIFDGDGFQLTFDETTRSSARMKTLQQLRDDDSKRQEQRATSFHGYEQDTGAFLDVTGAAARIPQTTTRQLRELKSSLVKSNKKLEDKRTQELLALLQGQQQFTRTALKQHKQLASSVQQQKHPRAVSTRLLTLDSIEKRGNGNNTVEEEEVRVSPSMRTMAPLQLQEPWYESQELMHPRRPTLATLNFDSRVLGSSSLPKHAKSSEASISYSEEESDDGEVLRRRLGERQREEFASSAANGLFLGGGFIAKKTSDQLERKAARNSTSSNGASGQASERESLETVLGTHSASILPLAEANKPALRRREANAGRRRPKRQQQPPVATK
jgi:hypothetical protein